MFNSRGINLFTCVWKPAKEEPKALLFLCHGYAMESSITMKSQSDIFIYLLTLIKLLLYILTNERTNNDESGAATKLAKAGFAVYGMDYEGHGKSEGLNGYISNFDDLVDDVSIYYSTICGNFLENPLNMSRFSLMYVLNDMVNLI